MTNIGSFEFEKKAAIVVVILEDPLEASKKAAYMGADILEIRLDLLGIRNKDTASEIIRKIKLETGLPVIITNRSQIEGGKWEGKEAERIGILSDLLAHENGADAVDIELSTEREYRDKVVEAAKSHGKTVIMSSHDFSKTPPFQEMRSTLAEAFLAGADIAKLAVTPNSMRNVLDLLELTLDAREARRAVCTIAMGNLGKHTRVVAPFYGSILTYASVGGTASAAPGQLPVDELKKIMELLE
ncbi:MAG TPA: type I 3-dehydroquinate dehydratase [Methanosarcina sp.]|nr:type I 3-dehydroquinate dehydratase [Methanosarcina sp.]